MLAGKEASLDGESLFAGPAGSDDRCGDGRGDEVPGGGPALWGGCSRAVKWVERYRETGSRRPVGTGGHRPSVLKPHRDFLVAVRAEQPDITLEALSRRLAAERCVKADTSMLSRFFRREGITFKKRRWSRASAIART